MTQAILADRPDGHLRVLGGVPSLAAAEGGPAEREYACLLVPRERCGASQFQPCLGAQPCGARRLLAVERGHLDPDTGAWLTRGWALGRELRVEVGR
jgi:hypothetical protein